MTAQTGAGGTLSILFLETKTCTDPIFPSVCLNLFSDAVELCSMRSTGQGRGRTSVCGQGNLCHGLECWLLWSRSSECRWRERGRAGEDNDAAELVPEGWRAGFRDSPAWPLCRPQEGLVLLTACRLFPSAVRGSNKRYYLCPQPRPRPILRHRSERRGAAGCRVPRGAGRAAESWAGAQQILVGWLV